MEGSLELFKQKEVRIRVLKKAKITEEDKKMLKSIGTAGVLCAFILLLLAFSRVAFAGPAITSITPNTAGGDWIMVKNVEVMGTDFVEGARVTLTRGEGHPDITVEGGVESSTKFVGGFAVRNIEPGAYDVLVENPDGQSSTLTGGFTFTE